jgi:AcrR family transcriptional regulator
VFPSPHWNDARSRDALHRESVGSSKGRRERLRAETTANIKTIALLLMASGGPDAITLRAVAREMGMTANASYGYFATRDDLVTTLINNVYTSLADTVEASWEAAPGAGAPPPFTAAASATARWNRADSIKCGSPRAWPLTYCPCSSTPAQRHVPTFSAALAARARTPRRPLGSMVDSCTSQPMRRPSAPSTRVSVRIQLRPTRVRTSLSPLKPPSSAARRMRS